MLDVLELHSLYRAVADTAPAGFNIWSLLASAGVAGVFAGLFVTNRIVSRATLDAVTKDRDAARAQVDRLYTAILDGIVPAIKDLTIAVKGRVGDT